MHRAASHLVFNACVATAAISVFSNHAFADSASMVFEAVVPGMEFGQVDWRAGAQTTIHLSVVRVDPRRVATTVVDTRSMSLGSGPSTQAAPVGYTLREVARIQHPLAALNGGFTESYVVPIPTGLVKVRGKRTSLLNEELKSQSGILCVDVRGLVAIVPRSGLRETECAYAIQAGPIIVEATGVNGVFRNARAIARRSVVGIDKTGRVLMIATSEASLFVLGEGLKSDGPLQLGLVTALNLDGDADSGLLLIRHGKMELFGNIDATIPNALTVTMR